MGHERDYWCRMSMTLERPLQTTAQPASVSDTWACTSKALLLHLELSLTVYRVPKRHAVQG